MTAPRAAHLNFDFDALQHNLQRVRELAPDSSVMPVIKANAYGHGMLAVARALESADGFAVAQLAEAIHLRQHGIDKPITVFQGFRDPSQLEAMVAFRLWPAISQIWQLELLEASQAMQSKAAGLNVWLKVNTGMGRLGLLPGQVEAAWQRIQSLTGVQQSGLMSHFANADDPLHASNQQQLDCFRDLAATCGGLTSLSNSAGIVQQLEPNQNWVRPGIMLYGASPIKDKTAESLGLKPVMQLRAELIAINQLKKGDTVGYGYQWCCPEDMPIGIVNLGYADGYPRHAATGTPIVVNGQMSQLLGRVSMDSIAVDLRNISAAPGCTVEAWGKQISVDVIAEAADTISYELLCRAGCQLDIE